MRYFYITIEGFNLMGHKETIYMTYHGPTIFSKLDILKDAESLCFLENPIITNWIELTQEDYINFMRE